jgi:hypothetical protein
VATPVASEASAGRCRHNSRKTPSVSAQGIGLPSGPSGARPRRRRRRSPRQPECPRGYNVELGTARGPKKLARPFGTRLRRRPTAAWAWIKVRRIWPRAWGTAYQQARVGSSTDPGSDRHNGPRHSGLAKRPAAGGRLPMLVCGCAAAFRRYRPGGPAYAPGVRGPCSARVPQVVSGPSVSALPLPATAAAKPPAKTAHGGRLHRDAGGGLQPGLGHIPSLATGSAPMTHPRYDEADRAGPTSSVIPDNAQTARESADFLRTTHPAAVSTSNGKGSQPAPQPGQNRPDPRGGVNKGSQRHRPLRPKTPERIYGHAITHGGGWGSPPTAPLSPPDVVGLPTPSGGAVPRQGAGCAAAHGIDATRQGRALHRQEGGFTRI